MFLDVRVRVKVSSGAPENDLPNPPRCPILRAVAKQTHGGLFYAIARNRLNDKTKAKREAEKKAAEEAEKDTKA